MVRGTLVCSLLLGACYGFQQPVEPPGDLLGRLEHEVASIVARTRSAVVSVYDDPRIDLAHGRPAPAGRLAGQAAQYYTTRKELAQKTRPAPNQSGDEARDAARSLNDALREAQSVAPGSPYGRFFQRAESLADAPKSGTGFSVGDGYIVTTADVLDGMKNPIVLTDAGVRVRATIVGIESDLNVGLLRILGKVDIPALEMGDSSTVQPGHFVISIGNQNGQDNSVALNLVGGVRRQGTYSGRRFYPALIQIAGTVGAGTSGAPLVDSHGMVVGMITGVPVGEWAAMPYALFRAPRNDAGFVAAPFGFPAPGPGGEAAPPGRIRILPGQPPAPPGPGDQGQAPVRPEPGPPAGPNNGSRFEFFRPPVTSAGFAIPIDEIKPVLGDLRSGRRPVRGWIGISTHDEVHARETNNIITLDRDVVVEAVFQDSPAVRAGMQPGDIIVSIDSQPVHSTSDIRSTSVSVRPGDTLDMTVQRGGVTHNLTVKIDARPARITSRPITRPATK